MKIESMFTKPIDRNINAVIKVGQEDAIQQEVEEYVLTKELEENFHKFISQYKAAIDTPSEKMGVWISGFFGSGKSHFLKMISYLLTNPVIAGKHVVDYFSDKWSDAFLRADVERCAKLTTESILFNISSVSVSTDDDNAIRKAFASQFYEHLGYHGDNYKVVKLERYLDSLNKRAEFEKTFEEIAGQSWDDAVPFFDFLGDSIEQTLQAVLNMSPESAKQWTEKEEQYPNNKNLAKEIAKYVSLRSQQDPNFRLLFMLDEIGQFIGEKTSMMLDLQTIVEELATHCHGQVWVMVTSQESIDTFVKVKGPDFSKITGRFDVRLSLSSADVDEVIRKRLLDKTEAARQTLCMLYNQNQSSLKSKFSFTDTTRQDLMGFCDEKDFIASFPFTNYQFKLLPQILREIRRHGNSGKHLSGGERSLLSGFHDATLNVKDLDKNHLVPLYSFYKPLDSFLDADIRNVIQRAATQADQGGLGLEKQDIPVLQTLYLIRYLEADFKATVNNIAILMIDQIDPDMVKLRERISQSLDRLIKNNNISRRDDSYYFLTNEEQDISREIKETVLEDSCIPIELRNTIFGEIFKDKKINDGKYNDSFKYGVDDYDSNNKDAELSLEVITDYNQLSSASDQELAARTSGSTQALIVLPANRSFYGDLEKSLKIDQYLRSKDVNQLSPDQQQIFRQYRSECNRLRSSVKEQVEEALSDARVFVCGQTLSLPKSPKGLKIQDTLKGLATSVYRKRSYLSQLVDDEKDVKRILSSSLQQGTLEGFASVNDEALKEIITRLTSNSGSMSLAAICKNFGSQPCGWRAIDIAALVAQLLVDQKITIKRSGNPISKDDPNLPSMLCKTRGGEMESVIVSLRQALDVAKLRKAISILKDLFGNLDIPNSEDGLADFIDQNFTTLRDKRQNLIDQSYQNQDSYPGRKTVQDSIDLLNKVLSYKNQGPKAFIERLIELGDDLIDSLDDMSAVTAFFKSQKDTYDTSKALLQSLQSEGDYLSPVPELTNLRDSIKEILDADRPYKDIPKLPDLNQKLETGYNKLVDQKRSELKTLIDKLKSQVLQVPTPENSAEAEVIRRKAADYFDGKLASLASEKKCSALDALKSRLQSSKDSYIKDLVRVSIPTPKPDLQPEGSDSTVGGATIKEPKVATLSWQNLIPSQHQVIRSEADIESLLNSIRHQLSQELENNDAISLQ
jgi:hypothetical protein